jgi:hypothetical protein
MKMSHEDERNTAREAAYLLQDLMSDLITAARADEVFKAARGNVRHGAEQAEVGLNRMRFFHLFMTLCKCKEFYDHFKWLLPKDIATEFKKLRQEIVDRDLVNFRNKYVGHLWDKTRGGPLTPHDVDAMVSRIQRDEESEFVAWVHRRGKNVYPRTVVSILEHARCAIIDRYGLAN